MSRASGQGPAGSPGRTAVVTGAGGGLGREIARRLAADGYAVHITDVDPARAEAVAREVNGGESEDGPRRAAFSSGLDVRDAAACSSVAASTVDRTGSLDLWVNNAGVLFTGPVWEPTPDQRRLMLEVNALGTINGTLAALEWMRPAGYGHVVNVASLAGLVGVPGEGIYAASKHAVLGFSVSALGDLRSAGLRNIDISCVCPDGMWTPMLHDKLDDPGASLSFSGVLLDPGAVAGKIIGVVRRPRPVTSVPGWRGAQVRLLDLLPGLAVRLAPAIVGLSRRQQRSTARRIRRRGSAPSA